MGQGKGESEGEEQEGRADRLIDTIKQPVVGMNIQMITAIGPDSNYIIDITPWYVLIKYIFLTSTKICQRFCNLSHDKNRSIIRSLLDCDIHVLQARHDA